MNSKKGITLIELMVAMAIFVFIGVATIGMLRTGLNTWRTGEIRRESLETAQMVLSQLSRDLRSIYTQGRADGRYDDIKLVCDFDANARQRIRFVRTIEGAISPYAQKEAGACLNADKDTDLIEDYREARMGLLKPTGGLCEIIYTMDIDHGSEVLYRGLRSPVGGTGSFFNDSNVIPASANQNVIEFASGILFLGFEFWTQYTNTWDNRYWPLTDPSLTEKSGPSLWWDSTRSSQSPFPLEEREFTTYVSQASQYDYNDDIYPFAIKITVVVEEGEISSVPRLARDISSESTSIPLNNTGPFRRKTEFPYVKIDNEWIRYSKVSGDELILDEYGRGERFTMPESHNRGAVVRSGRTFTMTVWLPAGRDDWNAK